MILTVKAHGRVGLLAQNLSPSELLGSAWGLPMQADWQVCRKPSRCGGECVAECEHACMHIC